MSGRAFRLGELVERLGGELVGDPELVVTGIGTLGGAGPDRITFLTDGRYRDQLAGTRAAAVILAPADRDVTGPARIVASNPYTYFAHVARLFHPPLPVVPGVHATAVIAAGARIAPTASIGPGCVVEDSAEIGAGAALGPGSVVGAAVRVGAGTTLHAGVRVYRDCVIGTRCIVHAGVVIGADGFGFAPVEGRWLKIPQIGRVVIGDDVEIGANSTIDRGAIDDTVIEDGVKLDNQLQIGHNVRIGAHTAIAGCVGIAGSTSIGRHCMIGGAAMIGGHLVIADRVVIAGATTVTKSITASGTYLGVLPAAPAREWRKTIALLRNLDRMATRLRALEARLAQRENNE